MSYKRASVQSFLDDANKQLEASESDSSDDVDIVDLPAVLEKKKEPPPPKTKRRAKRSTDKDGNLHALPGKKSPERPAKRTIS
jgi:hypothetical protein